MGYKLDWELEELEEITDIEEVTEEERIELEIINRDNEIALSEFYDRMSEGYNY